MRGARYNHASSSEYLPRVRGLTLALAGYGKTYTTRASYFAVYLSNPECKRHRNPRPTGKKYQGNNIRQSYILSLSSTDPQTLTQTQTHTHTHTHTHTQTHTFEKNEDKRRGGGGGSSALVLYRYNRIHMYLINEGGREDVISNSSNHVLFDFYSRVCNKLPKTRQNNLLKS